MFSYALSDAMESLTAQSNELCVVTRLIPEGLGCDSAFGALAAETAKLNWRSWLPFAYSMPLHGI